MGHQRPRLLIHAPPINNHNPPATGDALHAYELALALDKLNFRLGLGRGVLLWAGCERRAARGGQQAVSPTASARRSPRSCPRPSAQQAAPAAQGGAREGGPGAAGGCGCRGGGSGERARPHVRPPAPTDTPLHASSPPHPAYHPPQDFVNSKLHEQARQGGGREGGGTAR